MIRQDYIIRMIQEIFAAIANLILRRKHISKSDWEEYESTARQVLEVTPQQLEEMDGQTILEKYKSCVNNKDKGGKRYGGAGNEKNCRKCSSRKMKIANGRCSYGRYGYGICE